MIDLTRCGSRRTSMPLTNAVPPVGGPHALQDLHGGRLARAVGAQDPEHLARRHGERDARDGLQVAIALAEVPHLDHRPVGMASFHHAPASGEKAGAKPQKQIRPIHTTAPPCPNPPPPSFPRTRESIPDASRLRRLVRLTGLSRLMSTRHSGAVHVTVQGRCPYNPFTPSSAAALSGAYRGAHTGSQLSRSAQS